MHEANTAYIRKRHLYKCYTSTLSQVLSFTGFGFIDPSLPNLTFVAFQWWFPGGNLSIIVTRPLVWGSQFHTLSCEDHWT